MAAQLAEGLLGQSYVRCVWRFELQEIVALGLDCAAGDAFVAERGVAGQKTDIGVAREDFFDGALQAGEFVLFLADVLLPHDLANVVDEDRQDIVVGAAERLSVDGRLVAFSHHAGEKPRQRLVEVFGADLGKQSFDRVVAWRAHFSAAFGLAGILWRPEAEFLEQFQAGFRESGDLTGVFASA